MEKCKNSYKNNKFKISAPTQNEEFELPDEAYSAPDIQDMENRITFKIKTGYYLELLTPEMIKLLGSTEIK